MNRPTHKIGRPDQPVPESSSTAGAYGFTRNEQRVILILVVATLVLFGVRAWRDHSRPRVPGWVTEEVRIRPAQAARADSHTPENEPSAERRIDVNTATQDDLTRLPGIGPTLAGRIVAYRRQHGPLRDIEDLKSVRGIGPKRVAALGGLISFGDRKQSGTGEDGDQP